MVYHPVWFNRVRLLGLPLASLAGCFVLTGNIWLSGYNSAYAQLRTGSSSRDLYQSQAGDERAVARFSANSGSQRPSDSPPHQVVQASHTDQVDYASQPEPVRLPAGTKAPAKLATCSSCNSDSGSGTISNSKAVNSTRGTPSRSPASRSSGFSGTLVRGQLVKQDQSILEDLPSDAEPLQPEPWDPSNGTDSFEENRLDPRHSSGSEATLYSDSIYGDSSCSTACGDRMVCFSPLRRFWCRTSVRAEMPLFWRRGHSTPALITTSPLGTPADTAGQLGLDSTDILQEGVFGQDARAGLRLTFSTYFDDCRTQGVVFRYWNAGTRNDRSLFDSNDFPILARPFLNTSDPGAPAQDTQLVAFPGDTFGNAEVHGRSDLYGFDISMKRLIYSDRFSRVHWIYGYQQVSLGERLHVGSQTTVIGDLPPLQGATISVSDQFRTHNRFTGSNLGLQSTRRFGCFHLETMIQLGLGNLRREVQVNGSTTTTSGGTSSTSNEGLLARQTNSRRIIDDTFVIAPEVGINLAYALTSGIDFTIGYNYLMVPKVYQASGLIDPDLRVNFSDPLVGELDPQLNLSPTRYWVRTLGLGLQMRY